MQLDLFGKQRFKVNLHAHTTLSDGKLSPARVMQRYQSQGYDAIALTDHWFFGEGEESNDFTLLSGAEFNIGGHDCRNGVYHILSIGAKRTPAVEKAMPAQKIIDAIHACGGLVILAHPAWSLNDPQEVAKLKRIDATEIYNTVSGVHMSRRPDSSLFVDMLAMRKCYLPLVADDDAHYYDNDDCRSWIMVEAADHSRDFLLPAIRKGSFYATQGPEIHLLREGDEITVRTSPVSEIILYSNISWCPRVFEGNGITEAHYKIQENESFIRAEAVDKNGKRAWTNIIPLNSKT